MKKVLLEAQPAILVANCQSEGNYYLLVTEAIGTDKTRRESYFLLHLIPNSSIEFQFMSLSNPGWGEGYHGNNLYGTPGELHECLTAALEDGHEVFQYPTLEEMCVGIAERIEIMKTGEVPKGSIKVRKETETAPSRH